MKRTIIATTLLTALLLLGGCATDRRNKSLESTLTAYGAALRWGSFAEAESFIDPTYRKAHPLTDLDMSRYKQVRVSDYDSGNGPIPVSKGTVRQVVRIGIINKNTQRERTIIDHQTWTWDAKQKHWLLETGLPDITPEQ
ncbi:hypothetical protein [Oleiagrimonas sp.]|jgi:hypothetical protein|uniref:hypothetical protein n=1 Tax=Oleiagrimonas sp. TaxID=2010330 RepID=UPI00262FB799|nr:hypothetical protein [Oleiagrimonas sp.]MDA3913345.1 hypothetical protein [Oleiagrimonas sp.]